MTIDDNQSMIKLEMKKYNMVLTEKQQKYLHYCRVKLINTNIKYITGEEILSLDQSRIVE